MLTGWLDRQEREAFRYLVEENRVLRRQLRGRRLQLTDDDRRRLAVRAFRLGRRALREIATIVAPRYVAPMAPAVDRAQVDVRGAPVESSRGACRDPAVGRTDGGGEFDVGLHADPRRAEKRRASRRPLHDRPD